MRRKFWREMNSMREKKTARPPPIDFDLDEFDCDLSNEPSEFLAKFSNRSSARGKLPPTLRIWIHRKSSESEVCSIIFCLSYLSR